MLRPSRRGLGGGSGLERPARPCAVHPGDQDEGVSEIDGLPVRSSRTPSILTAKSEERPSPACVPCGIPRGGELRCGWCGQGRARPLAVPKGWRRTHFWASGTCDRAAPKPGIPLSGRQVARSSQSPCWWEGSTQPCWPPPDAAQRTASRGSGGPRLSVPRMGLHLFKLNSNRSGVSGVSVRAARSMSRGIPRDSSVTERRSSTGSTRTSRSTSCPVAARASASRARPA